MSTEIKKSASRWVIGITIGLITYLGFMTLTTALHVTADLADWLLVALGIGSAVSAITVTGLVILALKSLRRSPFEDAPHTEPPQTQ